MAIRILQTFVFPKIAKIKAITNDIILTKTVRFVVIYSQQADEVLSNTAFSYLDDNSKLVQFMLPQNKDVYIFPVEPNSVMTINTNACGLIIKHKEPISNQNLNLIQQYKQVMKKRKYLLEMRKM